MGPAGIDTTHSQAHSLRSATNTKTVELGHSIQKDKEYANWSLNSSTFEKFYYKPSSQASSSTTINSSTENSITLEVGAESTGISLGTNVLVLGIDWMKRHRLYLDVVRNRNQLIYENQGMKIQIPLSTTLDDEQKEENCTPTEETVDSDDEDTSEADLYRVAVEDTHSAFDPVQGADREPFEALCEEYKDVFARPTT